jgi:hypothetical protein
MALRGGPGSFPPWVQELEYGGDRDGMTVAVENG